jgi:hypothetical protein
MCALYVYRYVTIYCVGLTMMCLKNSLGDSQDVLFSIKKKKNEEKKITRAIFAAIAIYSPFFKIFFFFVAFVFFLFSLPCRAVHCKKL